MAGFDAAAIRPIDQPRSGLGCVVGANVDYVNRVRPIVDDLQKDAEKNTPRAALAHYQHGRGSPPKLFSGGNRFWSYTACHYGAIAGVKWARFWMQAVVAPGFNPPTLDQDQASYVSSCAVPRTGKHLPIWFLPEKENCD